jgi:protein O-mannosyl-transferase
MGRARKRRGEAKDRASGREPEAQPVKGRPTGDRHAVFGIFVAVLVAYFPALDAGFTNWDDDRFITNNPLFRGPIGEYVAAALTRVQFQAYHPLHLLSYLPDRLFWPGSAAGFHALSLALFALALTLGYFLVRRSVSLVPALGAILLVGLSPLAVESVAWVVGRKDVLASLLVIATLLVEDREPRTRAGMVAAWGLAVLACLAKTSAVVLPILVFAWHHFARQLAFRATLVRCLPYAVIAVGFALPVPFIWRGSHMIPTGRPLPAVLDVLGTIGVYAGHVVVPANLSPVYPTLMPGQVIAALAVAATLLALAATWRSLPAGAKFAAVGFVGCLLPVANITPVYFRYADRYALLALFALAWPLGKLLAWPKARKIVLVAAPLALGAELWATLGLVPAWNDSLSLWQHAITEQPRAVYGYLKLGETLRAKKEYRKAAASYIEAGKLDRGLLGPAGWLRTLGERAEAEGRLPAGTADLWEKVIADPGFDVQKMDALIDALSRSRCGECAEPMLWLAIRIFQQSNAGMVGFAKRELERGRPALAKVYLKEVIARDPNTPGLVEVVQRLQDGASQPPPGEPPR